MLHIVVQIMRPAIAWPFAAPIMRPRILLGKDRIEIDLEHSRDHQDPREHVGELVRDAFAHGFEFHTVPVDVEELGARRLADLLIQATDDELHPVLPVAFAIDRHQIRGPVVCRPGELNGVGRGEDDVFPLFDVAGADGLSAIRTAARRELLPHRIDDGKVPEFVGDGARPAEEARERAFEIGLRGLLAHMLREDPSRFEEEEKALALEIHSVALAKEPAQIVNLALEVHGRFWVLRPPYSNTTRK